MTVSRYPPKQRDEVALRAVTEGWRRPEISDEAARLGVGTTTLYNWIAHWRARHGVAAAAAESRRDYEDADAPFPWRHALTSADVELTLARRELLSEGPIEWCAHCHGLGVVRGPRRPHN